MAVKIVQEGGLPPLIALLRSPLDTIQEQAAVAIRNISVNAEYDVKIVQVCVRVCCAGVRACVSRPHPRQYLYFYTCKASKLSSKMSAGGCARAARRYVGRQQVPSLLALLVQEYKY